MSSNAITNLHWQVIWIFIRINSSSNKVGELDIKTKELLEHINTTTKGRYVWSPITTSPPHFEPLSHQIYLSKLIVLNNHQHNSIPLNYELSKLYVLVKLLVELDHLGHQHSPPSRQLNLVESQASKAPCIACQALAHSMRIQETG